jgi:hypothetical protein
MSSAVDNVKLPEETSRSTSQELREKHDGEVSDVVEDLDSKEPASASPDDYPHGTQLIFIVAALLLNIFLVALDMVR